MGLSIDTNPGVLVMNFLCDLAPLGSSFANKVVKKELVGLYDYNLGLFLGFLQVLFSNGQLQLMLLLLGLSPAGWEGCSKGFNFLFGLLDHLKSL